MMKKSISCILTLLLIAFSLSSCGIVPGVNESRGSASLESIEASEDLSLGNPSSVDVSESKSHESKDSEESSADITEETSDAISEVSEESKVLIDAEGVYTSAEDVGLYIHTYGKLPGNFITKSEARALGWEGGGLDRFAPGKCIGGDRFGNYEELLPEKKGRFYTECDIDTLGKSSRGAKRIVFSNDGLVYYTDDHYESFTLLYGEE